MENTKEGPRSIGQIEVRGKMVGVYFDPLTTNKNTFSWVWQMRNPDSGYQGILYMNNQTGKITHPEGAIIPVQTDEDREILPKFIIGGVEKLNDTLIVTLYERLIIAHRRKNRGRNLNF